MPRRKLQVSREKFEQAVQEAESKGPLKNISFLCDTVSKIYNNMDVPEKLNPQVVGLRLKEYSIETKTKKSRRGRKPEKIIKTKVVKTEAIDKTVKTFKDDTDVDSSNYSRMLNVCTPSGICPIKLQSTGKQEVRKWAQDVVEAGYKQNKNYTHDAIKYFVRHFYDMCSEAWKIVIGHLELWLQEEKVKNE